MSDGTRHPSASHEPVLPDFAKLVREADFLQVNQSRTLLVVLLTLVMMGVELYYGYTTGSLALLADGWHMASHAGALGLTYLVYRLAQSPRLNASFPFGTGKFIPLGGYTSAIALAIVAVLMIFESVSRFFSPNAIQFGEAIVVSFVGLLVNLASAFVLGRGHGVHSHVEHGGAHQHNHVPADHNLRGAYMHVLADALTSLLALAGLFAARMWNAPRIDVVMGGLGGVVILRWSYQLAKDVAWELLDGHAKSICHESLRKHLETDGTELLSLRTWLIAPHLKACELIVRSRSP